MSNNNILEFNNEFAELANEIDNVINRKSNINNQINEISDELSSIKNLMKNMPLFDENANKILNTEINFDYKNDILNKLEQCNTLLDSFDKPELRGKIVLTISDYIVCIVTGIISTLMDVLLVGKLKTVDGKPGSGSFFTEAIRKIGNSDDGLSKLLKDFSDKCKVSYDISTLKNTVYPKNHRLRSFAHDPVFGLFFAIFDIKFGTCTLIDNSGHITITHNPKQSTDATLIMCIVYFIGHILSDVCTSQGVPIPGFAFTQFFVSDDDNSFADICEKMYVDGYDLRHLVTMSTPVFVKSLIIEIYYRFFKHENNDLMRDIAMREIDNNVYSALKYRLLLIPDIINSIGNIAKFVAPPDSMNPTAINLPVWLSCIKDGYVNIKYETRDKTIEQIEYNRKVISENWEKLMFNL